MGSSQRITYFTIGVVALLIGLVAGYFYANPKNAYDRGVAAGRTQATAEAQAAAAREAEAAAKAANPFNKNTNPFDTSYKNPFGQVKTNPFAQ